MEVGQVTSTCQSSLFYKAGKKNTRSCLVAALIALAVLFTASSLLQAHSVDITSVSAIPSPGAITVGADGEAHFDITVYYIASGFSTGEGNMAGFDVWLYREDGTCGDNNDFIYLPASPNGSGSVSRHCCIGGPEFKDYCGNAYIQFVVWFYDAIPLPVDGDTYTLPGYTIDCDCTYGLSSYDAQFPASGGTGSFNVSTQTGCPWTATSGQDWVEITSGSSGTGSGTVSYSVAFNTGSERNASINAGGRYHHISQDDGTTNDSPVANAGPDQTLTDTDGNGSEDVTLDGGGSDDPDGTIQSYVWTESGTQIATGETPTVTLSVSTHTITLTVTDDDGATDTDEVVITVGLAPVHFTLHLRAYTLPGGYEGGIYKGGTSVGLDWWLGDIPDGGDTPPQDQGITWTDLGQYEFELFRDGAPVFRVDFPDASTVIAEYLYGEYWTSYQANQLTDYRYRDKHDAFFGLFDLWTEYEDYDVIKERQYTYEVVLYYEGEEVTRSKVVIVAGAFAWGVVARDDLDLGDPVLKDQLKAVGELSDEGLGFCKFWMHGDQIEKVDHTFNWSKDVLPNVNWANPEFGGSADAFDNIVERYAFPNLNDGSEVYWNDYDALIEGMNALVVSPVPWLGHGPTAPDWSEVWENDKNQWLTRLYVHCRAAARRYKYGLRKVPMWNLENELNWTLVHPYAFDARHDPVWQDNEWLEKVWRALSKAIEHENQRAENLRVLDVSLPVAYARRMTNFNIHCTHTTAVLGLIWNLLVEYFPDNVEAIHPSCFRTLQEYITDWKQYFDIIGLGAYPNYLNGTPLFDVLLELALHEAVQAAGDLPVMVVETGYPSGPGDGQYRNNANKAEYIRRSASHALHEGGAGYFYFTLFSEQPETVELTGDILKDIALAERYWGLLKTSVSATPGEYESSEPFLTYASIIRDGYPDITTTLDVVTGIAQLVNGKIDVSANLSITIPEGAVIPEGEISLVVGIVGGSASDYGSSVDEIRDDAGVDPVEFADVKIIGTDLELGLVDIGLSIGLDNFSDENQALTARLYIKSGTWVEATNTVARIVGDVVQITGQVLADQLQGTPVCVGVPPTSSRAVFRVTEEGDVRADGDFYGKTFETGAADVAEWVSVSEPVEPGDVLELDPDNPGHYRKSQAACSSLVAGVVSTDPGFVLGSEVQGSAIGVSDVTYDSRLPTPDSALLALIGIVPVKVTNEGGPIQPGDLLVSSSTPGYAMKWDPKSGPTCGLIGKALEPLEEEHGIILVLLTAH